MLPGEELDSAILDLAAVLEGLSGDQFEILLVGDAQAAADDVLARAPGLPLHVIDGKSIASGCDAALYDLIFVGTSDGQFDVRELNHLLEAIEHGADVAAGYRPRRMDAIVRQFQRFGWKVDVDCAFVLLRRNVWNDVAAPQQKEWCCAEVLANARRRGYHVVEVPVSHRRPTIGIETSRAA
jgi:hypothetical protein